MKISPIIEVVLQKGGFVLPFDLGETWCKENHKRVLLKAKNQNYVVETHVALRKTLGAYTIYFGQQHQKALHIKPSETFKIQLHEDTTKYGVEPPEAFTAVYESDPLGAECFDQLSDGKKRGVIFQIKRYKSAQVQVDKTLLLFENLKRGIRDTKMLFKAI